MSNQGASFSSSSTHSYVYDVFLSYNSADTRAFSCHLHYALCVMEINSYLHEEPVSEKLSAKFLKIYEQSKMSLIVFSETLASSAWLDQLAKIIQCKKSKQQLLQPIFYKVDPTTLRDRSVWLAAPWKVENLSRWCFMEGYDSHFVHMVVKDIPSMLPNGRRSVVVAMHTVGMGSRVGEICDLLNIGEDAVHMVGIWGMGGLGKTTIARSVFNSIARRFEGSCFLANVREMSRLHESLVRLQETLLTGVLEDRGLRVTNVSRGMQLIKEKLSRKRVLLVLDDVDDYNILQALARSTWFGSGSRIIITTRDRHVLVVHGVETIYEPKLLPANEALELFSWHAFRGLPSPDYEEVAMRAIEYARGHPLLLIVLGSSLRGRSIDEWKETFHSKADRYYEVQHVLRQSYDALDDTAKIAFLDIACFFKGKEIEKVQQILENSGLDFSAIAIQELVEKALITIQNQPSVDDVISMHDLIEEMGRDIVRQESIHEPGERSRLWHHEDVDHVLTSNTGTDKIRGIMVKFPDPDEIRMILRPESFLNMKNLKFFITGDVCLSGDLFTRFTPKST